MLDERWLLEFGDVCDDPRGKHGDSDRTLSTTAFMGWFQEAEEQRVGEVSGLARGHRRS